MRTLSVVVIVVHAFTYIEQLIRRNHHSSVRRVVDASRRFLLCNIVP